MPSNWADLLFLLYSVFNSRLDFVIADASDQKKLELVNNLKVVKKKHGEAEKKKEKT